MSDLKTKIANAMDTKEYFQELVALQSEEIDRLRARNAKLTKRCDALSLMLEFKEELLVAHRLGIPPKETTWKKADKAEKALAAAEGDE